MAHINVSIFCSLQGPYGGASVAKRSQVPLAALAMTMKITYNNLYDVTALKGRVLQHAGKFGVEETWENELKAGERSFTVEAAAL